MKKLFVCLALVTSLVACKKTEDKKSEPVAGSAAAPTPAPTPAADANADHITVLARHKEAKPIDPVHLNFEKWRVVKADFDPKKIEGGKATIEIDLSSFHTDSDKRDAHVKSESYLDIGKFATATIDIDNVKLQSGTTYSADANVSVHGVSKKLPVTFDVVEQKDDHIKIKGKQSFSRQDFAVGTDPAKDTEQQVSNDLEIELLLTIAVTK